MDIRHYHWILAFTAAILLHSLMFMLIFSQTDKPIPVVALKTVDIHLSAVSERASGEVTKLPVETVVTEKLATFQELPETLTIEKPAEIKKRKAKVPEQAKKTIQDNKKSIVEPVVKKPINKQPEQQQAVVTETIANTLQDAPTSSTEPDKPEIVATDAEYAEPSAMQSQQAVTDNQENDVIRASYAANLSHWLARHKRYPRKAKRKKQQGIVNLEFTVSRLGLVGDYRIINSSGYKLLDEEVKKMLKRATPLPAFPETIIEGEITITVPISFKLS